MYLNQSVFSRQDSNKDQQQQQQLPHGLYTPAGVNAQSSLYASAVPGISNLSSGIQGLSLHPSGSRSLGSTPSQFGLSRANTAPGGYGGMANVTGIPGLSHLHVGAPSPPPNRSGMLPLGNNRTGLMGAGQTLTNSKQSRPSSLSSAIGSALPSSVYGNLGRSAQGMMSPVPNLISYGISENANQGFDMSEFPVLSMSRNRHDSSGNLSSNSSALPPRPGYVSLTTAGQLPKPPESVPGFQMHSEDFPALPGTSTKTSESSELAQENNKYQNFSNNALPEPRLYDPAPGSNKERFTQATPIGPPKGTKKSSQATTVSIPPGMVQDQFGMMGLLTFIRGAETDQNLVALALGSDLTTLGLNLNSPESLYNTFASPWADSPCRPQDIDFTVPQEYLINSYIREKLGNTQLARYNEDLLFFLYYSYGGDLLQLLAAHELYGRDWRYHKEERIWITRAPGMKPTKQETTFEEGTYCYFDVNSWRKSHKEFHVEYEKLEDRPQMPAQILGRHGLNLSAIPSQA